MKRLLLPLLLLLAGCSTPGKTDVQFNYFSVANNQCGIGEGGPNPQPATYPATPIFTPDNPAQYSAILKLSNSTFGLFPNITASQGNQDSLNIADHVHDTAVTGDLAIIGSPGLRVLTVKGGCTYIWVDCTLHGHGTSEDVKVGDWMDQTYNYSDHVDLAGCKEADGSKINVIVGHAKHVVLGPNEHYEFLPSMELKAYWWFKYGVRQVLGIPVGTPGPKWLP